MRAFDRDLAFDDPLGFATTDADGRFRIRYDESRFRDVLESRPDVYLQVFDAAGLRLLEETPVRRNASRDEVFSLRISGTLLVP